LVRVSDIGEIGLIERFAKGPRPDRSVVRGIGDDTAVISWSKDKYLLFTCDMLVEDTHFRLKEATPFQIGWKALSRNISDIAAMGGVPRYALVSCAVNPAMRVSFTDGIYKGLRAAAARFGVNIVGGDTSRSKKLVMDVSLLGEVEKDCLVTRDGAREGDVIFVTGAIGGASKGRHLNFIPRLEESRRLVKGFRISSMIDVSDGLLLDLWRILKASGVGAQIYESTVPLSREADSFERGIREGEDFELLFTMSVKEARRFFKTLLPKMKTPVTLIGEVLGRKTGLILRRRTGREKRLDAKGFTHF
jgi:thiamine-monophosphate kinase